MKFKILVFFLLYYCHGFAGGWKIDTKVMGIKHNVEIQNTLNSLSRILPKSWMTIEFKSILFVDSLPKQQYAKYNKRSKRLLLSKNLSNLILEDDLLVQKIFIEEFAYAYEDQIQKISSLYSFQLLSGWHKRGLIIAKKKRRNFDKSRALNKRLWDSPQEAFAKNMQYFLTDKAYACKSPSLYNFFSNKFDIHPKSNNCASSNILPVVINNTRQLVEFDPQKLYAIHYLFADSGNGVESRLGHSMLRLVFCSPERQELSEKCVQDINDHIVLSFAADIEGKTNYFKGLTGGYDLKLFLSDLNTIINQYTLMESRNLVSYPLDLSPQHKMAFLNRVKEEAWSYRGKYRFLSQNCATESSDIIKSSLLREDLNNLHVRTPKDLFRKYKKKEIISEYTGEQNEKRRKGYFFESKHVGFKRSFEKLQNFSDDFYYEEFINDSTAKEREKIFHQVIHEDNALTLVSSLYMLESFILKKRVNTLSQEIEKDLIRYNPDLFYNIQQFAKLSSKRIELENSQGSYGVPNRSEIKVNNIDPENIMLQSEAIKEFQNKYFSEQMNEILNTQKNIQNYKSFFNF